MKATKNSSVERVNPSKGPHVCVISQIIDWGTVTDSFGKRRKVEFVCETDETHVFNEKDGEQPILIDRKFSNNLGSVKRPSALREFIEGITGEEIDGDEYELEDLIGFAFKVQIKITKDGEYENAVHQNYSMLTDKERKNAPEIQGLSGVLDLENFDEDFFNKLPAWKQGEIAKSPEGKALGLKAAARQDEVEEEEEEEEKPKAKGKNLLGNKKKK